MCHRCLVRCREHIAQWLNLQALPWGSAQQMRSPSFVFVHVYPSEHTLVFVEVRASWLSHDLMTFLGINSSGLRARGHIHCGSNIFESKHHGISYKNNQIKYEWWLQSGIIQLCMSSIVQDLLVSCPLLITYIRQMSVFIDQFLYT